MEHKKRLLLIGALALAFGALSSLHIYKRLQAGLAPSRNEVDVVIAADDIQVGAKIGDHDRGCCIVQSGVSQFGPTRLLIT